MKTKWEQIWSNVTESKLRLRVTFPLGHHQIGITPERNQWISPQQAQLLLLLTYYLRPANRTIICGLLIGPAPQSYGNAFGRKQTSQLRRHNRLTMMYARNARVSCMAPVARPQLRSPPTTVPTPPSCPTIFRTMPYFGWLSVEMGQLCLCYKFIYRYSQY
ncbi:unnamed protein product [Nezara viridula]|uniref:Uncharacterized protein n=1 Tax=Nezara viridula TaxID=85310 RepID=A0A9P0HMS5_NEZVI|nr:unnamed protein product [Nezara viridula]